MTKLTEAQLMEGLRQADAAGNTQDANLFADLIRKKRASQKSNSHMSGGGVMGAVNDFASRANDMFLSEWGPKYRAGLKAVLPEALGGTGKGYEDNLQAELDRKNRIRTEQPWMNAAAETVGLGAQMATGAGLARLAGITAAPTVSGRLAQATGTGTATGAAYGSGEAQSGDEAFGALTGGILGGATGLLGSGLVEAGGAALARRGMSEADKAAQRVAKRMQADNVTPEAAIAKVREARKLGADEFAIMDAGGENTRRLGRAVKNLGGEAADALTDFAETRQAGQYDRFTRAVGKNVNARVDIDEVSGKIGSLANKKVGPIYKSIDDVVPLSRELKETLSRSSMTKDAFERAAKLAGEDGVPIEPILINGKFNPKIEQVSAKTMHYLRMGMDEVIDGQKRIGNNGQEQLSRLGGKYSETRGKLDAFLKQTSPQIREADAIWSQYKNLENAMYGGTKFDRLTPDRLTNLLKQTKDPKQRAMYRIGGAWNMFNKLGRMTDGRDITKAFLASPDDRKRLEALLNGSKNAKRLLDFRAAEKQMSKTNQRMMGNSTTAQQAADMDELTGERLARQISSPVQTFRDMISEVILKGTGVSEAEKKAITEILTAVDDDALQAMLGNVQRQTRALEQAAGGQLAADIGGTLAAGEASRDLVTR